MLQQEYGKNLETSIKVTAILHLINYDLVLAAYYINPDKTIEDITLVIHATIVK